MRKIIFLLIPDGYNELYGCCWQVAKLSVILFKFGNISSSTNCTYQEQIRRRDQVTLLPLLKISPLIFPLMPF